MDVAERCRLAVVVGGWVALSSAGLAQIEPTWTVTREGPGASLAIATAVALDGEGDLHVAGRVAPWTGGPADILAVEISGAGAWIRSIGRPGDPGTSRGDAIAVDAAGRTVVVGSTEGDLALTGLDVLVVCHDPDGTVAWSRTLDGGAARDDAALAVALDAEGNAIVTGNVAWSSPAAGFGGIVLKYDPRGELLWERRREAHYFRTGALAVDRSGSILVSGWSPPGVGAAVRTVKYSADGDELWTADDGEPAGGALGDIVVALDPDGNAVVARAAEGGAGTGVDWLVVKHASRDGARLWSREYTGSGTGADVPRAVAVDRAGNVVAAGESALDFDDSDLVTVTYAADGTELWVRRYRGPGNRIDLPVRLAADVEGNVVVAAGSKGEGTGLDLALIRYAPDGTELWVRRLGGPDTDYLAGIALDPAGDVLVAGWGWSGLLVAKFRPDGGMAWSRCDGGPGGSVEQSVAIAVDAAGGAIVAGSATGLKTGRDVSTFRVGPDGVQRWAARLDGFGGEDAATGLAVDAAGNVHVTGRSVAESGNRDFVTVRYAADGREAWVRRYEGPAGGDDEPCAIALDGAGHAIVAGTSYGGDATGKDFAAVKYAPDGTELWARRHDGPGRGDDVARALAVGADGAVVITGESPGALGGGLDISTVRYAADGTFAWERRYDAGRDDRPAAVALDRSGNAIVTGASRGAAAAATDIATVKYDPEGTELWIRRHDGPGGRADAPLAMAVSPDGRVLVTGSTWVSADRRQDCLTLALDADGNVLWARTDGEDADWSDEAGRGIAVDDAGSVYVAVGADGYDPYRLVKYDARGSLVWGRTLRQGVRAFALDDREGILVADSAFTVSRYDTLPFRRGLVDGDDRVNLVDAVGILGYLYLGYPEPACLDAADVDDSGGLGVADAVVLLQHLFRGGIPPEGPFLECGRDGSLDALDCERFVPCDPFGGVPLVTFYGRSFRADPVVFVVDVSGSMRDTGELLIAQREIVRALVELPDGTGFGAVFFDRSVRAFPAEGPAAPLDAETRALAIEFVQAVQGGYGSCCRAGLTAGLEMAVGATATAGAILFVSDGGGTCQGQDEASYLRQTLLDITERNGGRVAIHAFGVLEPSRLGEEFLQGLAGANGGTSTRIVR